MFKNLLIRLRVFEQGDLLRKTCLSFLIYAFLKKAEQASILEMNLSAQ